MNKSERRLLFAQKVFFQIFVFLIPTQLGYHFWFPFSYIFGIRVDYFSPTIYLTDIIFMIIGGLFLWSEVGNRNKPNGKFVAASLLLMFFAAVNLIYATSFPIAMIKWIKIFELFLLASYVVYQKKLKYTTWFLSPLVWSAAFFSVIGLGQFILQRSIGGPLYFLGERSFYALTPGIALGEILGRHVLRAYSTFSHPNSFAGFLAVGGIVAIFYSPKAEWRKWFRVMVLALVSLALVTTLSRWILVVILLCLLAYFLQKKGAGLFFKNSDLLIITVAVASLLLAFVSRLVLDKGVTFSESFTERLIWAQGAGEIVINQPLVGVGLNNYILNLPRTDFLPVVWRLQPVHNIFLLVIAESGLIGLGVFSVVLMDAIKKAHRFINEKRAVYWAIVTIVLAGLADHYWLTLQQNQLMLALLLGLTYNKDE